VFLKEEVSFGNRISPFDSTRTMNWEPSTAQSKPPEGPKNNGLLQSSVANVSLPSGGGTIKGMGESFRVNAVTGSGSASIPINISQSRGGIVPGVSLSYDSGSGNGEFGMGWSLSGILSIERKTARGVPRYEDEIDSDVFILAGMEDLVPMSKTDPSSGNWLRNSNGGYEFDVEIRDHFSVRRYRPRVGSLLSRIERWTDVTDQGEVYWKMISGDGSVTILGGDDDSRVFEVDAISGKKRIFSWLAQEQYDLAGNALLFTYKAEDTTGVDVNAAHEQNRTVESRGHRRYIKSIKYGNRTPNRSLQDWNAYSASNLPPEEWMFELIFDYGEYDLSDPKPSDSLGWKFRSDPFSVYQSGFEVRTYRLCRRILMFHHFPDELGITNCLVSAVELEYSQNENLATLSTATQAGFSLDDPLSLVPTSGPYIVARTPPLSFTYQSFPNSEELKQLSARPVPGTNLENLPNGVQGAFQWVDLYGEGLPGIFVQQGDQWYYKHNIGGAVASDSGVSERGAKFGPLEPVSSRPSLPKTNNLLFSDISGRSQPDIVQTGGPVKGFYRMADSAYNSHSGSPPKPLSPLKQFLSYPNIDLSDNHVMYLDFTGNGLADILVFGNSSLTWYECEGDEGYSEGRYIPLLQDEECSPKLVFKDPNQSVHLADLSGDGLVDLIRIRNGEICYWPNLGYKFGAKVTMDNAPTFDRDEMFSTSRLLLGDVDGSGTTDILYLKDDELNLYFNQAGNGWSSSTRISHSIPPVNQLTSLATVDLFGSGTMVLVWSTASVGDGKASMFYLDLTNGLKPHLLSTIKNNMGRETKFHYRPSTAFYLEDDAKSQPWVTRLPFPVHCVDRVETFDHISSTKYTERRSYHHGYYDPVEREFRGFGRVEQWDTEEYPQLTGGSNPVSDIAIIPASHTKQWFHTGLFLGSETLSEKYSHEYYGAATLLKDDVPSMHDMSDQETLEASRSLKGMVLREELYADDSSPKAEIPYKVTVYGNSVKILQPQGENDHAVFESFSREVITYNYERDLGDPRINHSMVLQRDEFDNTLKSVSISYGRLVGKGNLVEPADLAFQRATKIVCQESEYTNSIDSGEVYRTPLPSQSIEFEITGMHPLVDGLVFVQDDFKSNTGIFLDIPESGNGDDTSSTEARKRLLSRSIQTYRSGNLEEVLPIGKVDSLGLPGRSYSLCHTKQTLAEYESAPNGRLKDPMQTLTEHGGYTTLPGYEGLWATDGTTSFHSEPSASPADELLAARESFFLPRLSTDPFGNSSLVEYDKYSLRAIKSVDSIGNTTTSEIDYRILSPWASIDANQNRTEVAFDALGLVVAIAKREKESSDDNLGGIQRNLTDAQIQAYMTNPKSQSVSLLQEATERYVYDYHGYQNNGPSSPSCFSTLQREVHGPNGANANTIGISLTYNDALGRTVQSKANAEAAPGSSDPRWICSGWTVLNNKGDPVQKFENFFDESHKYQPDRRVGVASQLVYDPLGRQIAMLHPSKSWTKSVTTPWTAESWDENDTLVLDPSEDADVGAMVKVLEKETYKPTWYEARIDGSMGLREQSVAEKSRKHANTPSIAHFDALGKPFLKQNDTGSGICNERALMDIQGRVLETSDGLGRIITKNSHDLLGRAIHTQSMDSGQTWSLTDVTGNALCSLNSKGRLVSKSYDPLRREITTTVEDEAGKVITVNRTEYGEIVADADFNNLRGKVYRIYDQAGITTIKNYDSDGNILVSNRQLVTEYKATVDWSVNLPPGLEVDIYVTSSKYDALGKVISTTLPDKTTIKNTFNSTGLVSEVKANLHGRMENDVPVWTPVLKDVEYDAAGRRLSTSSGNDARTINSYDLLTKRLVRRSTTSKSGLVQDLNYTYDPVGNISSVVDNAQQDIFFRNGKVSPNLEYDYDATYRILEATGRDHLGQTKGAPSGPDAFDAYSSVDAAGDANAMARYTEFYSYDLASNILSVKHQISDDKYPGWNRTFDYAEQSQIEATRMGNKLTSTTIGRITENYKYDATGLTTSMPQLSDMQWDFRDQLKSTTRQKVTNGDTAETTWYVYDGEGQRIRKVTERQAKPGEEPRKLHETIYLGTTEIFSSYQGDGKTIKQQLERQSIIDESSPLLVAENWTGSVGQNTPGLLLRYILTTNIQSVSVELDDQGNLISYEEYSPYGSTTYQLLLNKVPKRYQFSGKERDESGLYYFGARYYAPWLGRWASVDPIGTGDGLNLFAYCGGNPVVMVDPNGTGRETMEWILNHPTPLPANGRYPIPDHLLSLYNMSVWRGVFMAATIARATDGDFTDQNIGNQPDRPYTPLLGTMAHNYVPFDLRSTAQEQTVAIELGQYPIRREAGNMEYSTHVVDSSLTEVATINLLPREANGTQPGSIENTYNNLPFRETDQFTMNSALNWSDFAFQSYKQFVGDYDGAWGRVDNVFNSLNTRGLVNNGQYPNAQFDDLHTHEGYQDDVQMINIISSRRPEGRSRAYTLTQDDKDDFLAMMGTRAVYEVGWLLANHASALGKRYITRIDIDFNPDSRGIRTWFGRNPGGGS
jgi:RHS repeat-associated protein